MAGRLRVGAVWAVLASIVVAGWHDGGEDVDPSTEFGFTPTQLKDYASASEDEPGIHLHALSAGSLTVDRESPFSMVTDMYVGERKAFEGGGQAFYQREPSDDRREVRRGLFSDEDDDEEDDVFEGLFNDRRSRRDSGRGWLADQVQTVERREREMVRRQSFMRENTDWERQNSRSWGLDRIDGPSANFSQRMSPLSNPGYSSGSLPDVSRPVSPGVGAYERRR